VVCVHYIKESFNIHDLAKGYLQIFIENRSVLSLQAIAVAMKTHLNRWVWTYGTSVHAQCCEVIVLIVCVSGGNG
jgi:hypothetical protein